MTMVAPIRKVQIQLNIVTFTHLEELTSYFLN